jgi:chromosome segregation ATPase
MKAAFSRLETRFLEADRARYDLTSERNEAVAALTKVEVKFEKTKETIAQLRAEKEAALTEAESNRQTLLSSSIPEQKQLGEALQATLEAKEKAATLEKRIASLQQTFDFTKEQYQHASLAAAEATSELQVAQARIEELEAAGPNTIAQTSLAEAQKKLRETNNEADVEQYELKIKRLEMEVESKDASLSRLHEKLADLSNARRGVSTRASSVPRSPRGSRAGTPVAGVHGLGGSSSGLSGSSTSSGSLLGIPGIGLGIAGGHPLRQSEGRSPL